MVMNSRSATLRRALEACVHGDTETAAEVFTDNVSAWSPNMMATSLAELTELLDEREDALTDVSVEIDALDVTGSKGFAEYRVSATFSGPFEIDENLAIEPNGRVLTIGAIVAVDFTGERISALRNYFDNVTLLHQMGEVPS
jgi:hypothetical protein